MTVQRIGGVRPLFAIRRERAWIRDLWRSRTPTDLPAQMGIANGAEVQGPIL